MKYSLLVQSLDPKPTRKELEAISVDIRSIARADCAFIVDDWFGIICSGLPLIEAETFQKSLRGLGVGSDVVADAEIPSLHHDFRCHRIDITGDEIILSTAMGRRFPRKRSELVFVSAGFLDREKAGSTREAQSEIRYTENGAYRTEVMRNVMKIEEKRFFRIDLFFWKRTPPNFTGDR